MSAVLDYRGERIVGSRSLVESSETPFAGRLTLGSSVFGSGTDRNQIVVPLEPCESCSIQAGVFFGVSQFPEVDSW